MHETAEILLRDAPVTSMREDEQREGSTTVHVRLQVVGPLRGAANNGRVIDIHELISKCERTATATSAF